MAHVESETLFRDLFDQAGIGMAVRDLRWRTVRCNQAFARLVGYTEAELRALDPLALAHPDDHIRIREMLREFADGSRARHRSERRYVRKDGEVRWGRVTSSLVCDSEGRPEFILMLLEDVNEQHLADASLRDAEELCRSITGSSPDFIMILDPEGRIDFINRTLPGLTVEAVIGTSAYKYVPERFWPAMRACFDRVLRTGEEGSYEVEMQAPDGSLLAFVSRVWPVRRRGQIKALALCATDVTAHRLLEKQLQHAQRMESVGRLAGGVAHDLNNQLSVIMGSAELARRRLAEPDAVEAELCRVQAAGERAATLTQQLLAFGRKDVLSARLLGLNTLVANVRDMVGRVIGEDIRLCLKLARVGQVCVDPVQLEQVILNLVINARDAMPDGGRLTLSTEEIAVPEGDAVLRPGRYALLRVTDTGIGMDAKTLALAFEPFFTTKEVGKGTGLGLAVARGIVNQAHGHIAAESESGKGSTFRIYLPVAEGAPEAEGPAAPAATGGTETLLLVEDERDVLDVTRRALEPLGYRVLAATSGAEALGLLATERTVHLLLTDVVMPGMDGQELACRALKENPLLRVLFLSGYPPEIVRRPDAARHVFVRKPATPAILARKVREALDGVPVA